MNESVQEYRKMLTGNPAKAEKVLCKLAKKGDLQAVEALNGYYEKCVTETKSAKEAAKIRKKAFKVCLLGAGHNSPHWLIFVGEMYRYGVGDDKNEKKAFVCYEKAAAFGSAEAIVTMSFFESAASQDNPEAMVLIAYLYANGKGASFDYERALEWLDRAEQSCGMWLQQELSEEDRKYYQSLLKDVDEKRKHCEVVSCMKLLENEGSSTEQRQQALSRIIGLALYRLGLLYEQGLGVAKDIRTAKQYFGEALHYGCREAALKL